MDVDHAELGVTRRISGFRIWPGMTVRTGSAAVEGSRERSWVVSTPIATEVRVHPGWTLRAGGAWRQVQLEALDSTAEASDPRNAVGSETTVDRPEVELALGLSWNPVERFSLDLMASGVAIGEERLSLALGALLVSAVSHEPDGPFAVDPVVGPPYPPGADPSPLAPLPSQAPPVGPTASR